MEKKTRPFGVLDQVGYVCGDMAGSFVNLFVDAYFLTFCTYVLGINPASSASRRYPLPVLLCTHGSLSFTFCTA